MSVPSMVFNRGTIKLLAALAIPAGIAYFFYYAKQQAEIEIEQVKRETSTHPIAEQLSGEKYSMKEVDDGNHVHWQLTAAKGSFMPNGHDVKLEDVVVEYFDSATKQLKMRLKAPDGTANQDTKDVVLSGANGRKVLAEGGGGKSKFECQKVELSKNNKFVATGGVIIDWPGVAKVSGSSASGSTNMATGPKDLKIIGNTHAEIAVR